MCRKFVGKSIVAYSHKFLDFPHKFFLKKKSYACNVGALMLKVSPRPADGGWGVAGSISCLQVRCVCVCVCVCVCERERERACVFRVCRLGSCCSCLVVLSLFLKKKPAGRAGVVLCKPDLGTGCVEVVVTGHPQHLCRG